MTFPDAKQRFSGRVADYVRYRPGYPREVLDLLRTGCGLRPDQVIADVGSGTGLVSGLFLEHGNRVFGVEPNAEMRAAGESLLEASRRFTSVAGSAEATTLPDDSVDFVVAGQAFHWFDCIAARREFRRILGTGGHVVILWNERLLDGSPFLTDYEALLRRFGTDYASVKESYPRPDQMREFFGENLFTSDALPHRQEFDFAGLSGRLRSSSYAPTREHPNFVPMMEELQRIFSAGQENGVVFMDYRTRMYAGKLDLIG